MPTPVTTAKHCLDPEASHALDEAVTATRLRGHAQTTSLHAVSAFLSLSPSPLREACIRSQNAAFYPRIQLKALDFCLSVSLDRLPISQPRVDEPMISNSLMAAIKRSQANQRRRPDALITVKSHQDQQLGYASSGVKVELQHLIVSILDDPIVSRVFSDAGFCSFDVKLALLRPFQGYFGYPLRGLDGLPDPGYNRVRFRFPFSGFGDEDGEYRRIGEVLVRHKGRNPLLVGSSSNEVLKGFVGVLEKTKECGFLPLEIQGINVVSIEEDMSKLGTEILSIEAVNLRLREVDLMVQNCLGPGLMVSFGDVKSFLGVDNGCVMGMVNRVVRNLTKLLEVYDTRVWLIGSAANDQMCMEFLHRFSSIDKDWDLQPLPITSVRPLLGKSRYKSSFMASFVPLGGFFSSPEAKDSFGSSYQCVTPYSTDRAKFEEIISSSSKGCMASLVDKQKHTLSPWLQIAEQGANNVMDDIKATDGKVLLDSPIAAMQRKHHNLCQCLNHNQSSPEPVVCQESFRLPTVRCSEEKIKIGNNEDSCSTSSSCKECDNGKINSCTSIHLQKHSLSQPSKTTTLRSSKSGTFAGKQSESPPRTEHPLAGGSLSPFSLCISGVDDGQTSPSSEVSVATDLALGLFSRDSKQQKKEDERFFNDSKTLYKALFEKVGRQRESLRIISQIVASSWTSIVRHQKTGLRGDVWLNLTGPDIFGKRKTAMALAEILYGSKTNFIHVDLCSIATVCCQAFGHPTVNGLASSRGKTVVDRIADELRKTPSCVVLFENVHSADPILQCSLLQAIKDGKFSDSYGRQVATNNRIFILTSFFKEKNSPFSLSEKPSSFPEERIGRAKCGPIQIIVNVKNYTLHETRNNFPCEIFLNKRKLNGIDEKTELFINEDQVKRTHKVSSLSFDLNLPAETSEADDANFGKTNGEYVLEKSDSWLEDFSGELSKFLVNLVFDPYDYDALVTKISTLVHASFNEVTNSKCLLEIEPKVIDQMVAAACLSNGGREVEDWIDRVLSKGFAEAQQKYQLTAQSTVMVATGEALYVQEQVHEACLPSKIILT